MRTRSIAARLLYIAAVTAIVVAVYGRWAYDDPFITYRYALNLSHGFGLVYNPGERVLSTTTPLLALILAPAGLLGADLAGAAVWIGAVCLGLGGLALWELSRAARAPVAGWVALALYPGFPLALTTLGSEMPLFLALCLGAFAFYAQSRYRSGVVCAALATLARPDGLLVALVLAGVDLLHRRAAWRDRIRLYALYAAIVAPWFLFAWAYFGSPLPATLAAKQAQGGMAISQRFIPGLAMIAQPYIARGYFALGLIVAALGLVQMLRAWRAWAALFAWTGAVVLAYAILGMSRYFWYYAPLVPAYVALVGLGCQAVAGGLAATPNGSPGGSLTRGSAWRRWAAAGLAAAILAGQVVHALDIARQPDSRVRLYEAIGDWIAGHTEPRTTVGALEVGILGYRSRRPMVDFAGLLQPDTAAHIRPEHTYDDIAVWAATRYQPDVIVAAEGSLPKLAAGYLRYYCAPVRRWNGSDYGHPANWVLYACGRTP